MLFLSRDWKRKSSAAAAESTRVNVRLLCFLVVTVIFMIRWMDFFASVPLVAELVLSLPLPVIILETGRTRGSPGRAPSRGRRDDVVALDPPHL